MSRKVRRFSAHSFARRIAIRFVGIEPDRVTAIKMAEKAASKIQR
jgi:hypothetical protein